MGIQNVIVRVLPDGRVSRAYAAAFLGVSPKTLANWATAGLGPKPHKVGGRVFYYECNLRAFVATGSREAV